MELCDFTINFSWRCSAQRCRQLSKQHQDKEQQSDPNTCSHQPGVGIWVDVLLEHGDYIVFQNKTAKVDMSQFSALYFRFCTNSIDIRMFQSNRSQNADPCSKSSIPASSLPFTNEAQGKKRSIFLGPYLNVVSSCLLPIK